MRVNTQPGAFVFQAGLTAPPGSLHYDAAPDADGNGDPLGGRGGLPAQNPTSQTWDAKRMAEERQRLEQPLLGGELLWPMQGARAVPLAVWTRPRATDKLVPSQAKPP